MTIDLVPFGGLQMDDNTVAWPPEMDVLMTVTGYAEAQQAAVSVELAPGHQVKVASLPALAILKVFVWSDRGDLSMGKDAIDLLTLLRSYADAGNFDRMMGPISVSISTWLWRATRSALGPGCWAATAP